MVLYVGKRSKSNYYGYIDTASQETIMSLLWVYRHGIARDYNVITMGK